MLLHLQRLSEMEARLLARLEQLSLRIEADFDAKLGSVKRESGNAQNSLSNVSCFVVYYFVIHFIRCRVIVVSIS